MVREIRDVEITGTLELKLHASRGRTLISGVELIANGLKRAVVPPAVIGDSVSR